MLTVSPSIPYSCQFASPELVREFIHQTIPLQDDPRWAAYGASSPDEYAHWALRSCGVVCVKMAVEGLTDSPPRPVMDWVREGQSIDGYLTELRQERPVEIGWKHSALAELAGRHGCRAELVADLTPSELAVHIRNEQIVIASVTSELGEDGPLTRRTGHLVVIYGVETDEAGRIAAVLLHNPSGRTPGLRADARISIERFVQGFSGRGIVIGA